MHILIHILELNCNKHHSPFKKPNFQKIYLLAKEIEDFQIITHPLLVITGLPIHHFSDKTTPFLYHRMSHNSKNPEAHSPQLQ